MAKRAPIENALFHLLDAVNRDRRPSAVGIRRAAVPPAAPPQIDALEQHWGRRLPPAYRALLGHHNGGVRLWFDVRLLSTGDIIADRHEGCRFADRSPALWQWIFARGTGSQDALAFDPSQVDGSGEMAVVRLSRDGERQRWSSLAALVQELMHRLLEGGANGTNLYYVWTDLWLSWPHTSSVHSRGYVPKQGRIVHPQDVLLFGRSPDLLVQPLLSEPVLAHVDVYFAQAVEATAAKMAIVLTDAPVDDTARNYYVYYEPCATLVIALNPIANDVTLYSDDMRWEALAPRFHSLLDNAKQLLQEGRIAEAVLSSVDGACAALRAQRPRAPSE